MKYRHPYQRRLKEAPKPQPPTYQPVDHRVDDEHEPHEPPIKRDWRKPEPETKWEPLLP